MDKLEHVKNGLQRILEHTDHLLKDSEILIKKKRYAAAIPLSILAIEEMGKSHILSELIRLQRPLSDQIWSEITRGGIAHVKKTTSMILSREKYLENTTQEDESRIENMMNEFGIPISDNQRSKIDNMLMKALFLRLEKLKHDCFYTDMDENKNWINFNIRFNEQQKEAIANHLFIIALRDHTTHKFVLGLPQKPFEQYSIAERKSVRTKWKKEVKPIMKKTDTKKLGRLIDTAILLINNTYPPDNRGLVTEKGSWFNIS